jgi:multicomponent Na+:H+ antiporter subunit E
MRRLPLARTLHMIVLWWVLTGGHPGSWVFGAPVVALAVWASIRLIPVRPRPWRPAEAPGFALFFIGMSVMGGIDVARRALDPRLPVAPVFFDYPMRLEDEAARVFFSGAINLLPGTLSAELGPGAVTVHALDRSLAGPEALRRLEEHVARLFGVELRNV